MWGSEVDGRHLPPSLSTLFFEICLSWSLELTDYATLDGHRVPRILSSLPPQCWVYSCTQHILLLNKSAKH